MLTYRLTFAGGGYTESENLDELNQMRAISPGTIEEIRKTFVVTGDPENNGYDHYQDAETRKRELQDNTFGIDVIETVTSPQPDGLN